MQHDNINMKNKNQKKTSQYPQWHSLREKKTQSHIESGWSPSPDSRLITGAGRDTLEDPPSGIRGKDLSNQEPHVLQWDVEMLRCWFW